MAKKVVLLTGGLKQIAGLIYNDTNAVPQRNKQCAWRARLAMATSVSQLAMQVILVSQSIFCAVVEIRNLFL
jgi:hypothetical protein